MESARGRRSISQGTVLPRSEVTALAWRAASSARWISLRLSAGFDGSFPVLLLEVPVLDTTAVETGEVPQPALDFAGGVRGIVVLAPGRKSSSAWVRREGS